MLWGANHFKDIEDVGLVESKSLNLFSYPTSNLTTIFSNEPILINGMKVIFDQKAPIHSVTLEGNNTQLNKDDNSGIKRLSIAQMDMVDHKVDHAEEDGLIFGFLINAHWIPRGETKGDSRSTKEWQEAFIEALKGGKEDKNLIQIIINDQTLKVYEMQASRVMKIIPKQCENKFKLEERTKRGFKFEWHDKEETSWTVWGHEPDAGAAKDYVGSQRWILRVGCGTKYLMANEVEITQKPPHQYSFWAQPKGEKRLALSHIPLAVDEENF